MGRHPEIEVRIVRQMLRTPAASIHGLPIDPNRVLRALALVWGFDPNPDDLESCHREYDKFQPGLSKR